MQDIEIIAVNDCSNDETLEILKNLSLTDKRIKIVNNKNNSGLLHSRAMGIIHSSGEYLMNLDPDDELYNSDNLEYLYNISNTWNVDIIEFNYYINSIKKNINVCKKFNKIIRKPNLFESIYNDDNTIRDVLITNKLIKREILYKAYELFYSYIYRDKWNYHEDNIWSILVHKLAASKLCIKKLIYIYNDDANKKSLMKDIGSLFEFKNYIYRFDMIRHILNNTIYSKYLLEECIAYIERLQYSKNFRKFNELNEEFKKKTISFLKTCIKFKKISEYYKEFIIKEIKI